MTAHFLANMWWWESAPYVSKLNKKHCTLANDSGHDYHIISKRHSMEPSTWEESYSIRVDLGLRYTLSHHNYHRYRRTGDVEDSHRKYEPFKANSRLLTSIHFHIIFTMGGQLKRIEPASCTCLQEDQEVWNILRDNGVTTFLERMSGYSALVSYGALATWSRGRVQIGNTHFTISTNAIASVTGLPASGVVYFKRSLQAELQDFIAKGEKLTKYLSGYVRESLLPPWDRVAESLKHSINLVREGEGPILHQGLLYLLYKFVASPAELTLFPPKHGRSRCTPTSSPLPSPASRPSSSHHRHLQVSSDSDSDVTIMGSSFTGFAPPVSLICPPPSPGQTCLEDPDVVVAFTASSPASSSELHLSDALLGLAKLYPDSPDSGLIGLDEELKEEGLNFQRGTENIIMDDSEISPQDIQMEAAPNWEDTATGNTTKDNIGTVADTNNHPEERHVELVTSILAKLQRSFSVLKAWEIFTDNTRAAITKDCSELLTLADQLAEESGSIQAKNIVIELKKLL
ncbi:hypothetical protein KI387_042836 [Taxus chinensis]|uniref:Uncharacterized protein n=1 Tax=Taxus chinensis TaxID=29808 RepID=A0AA38F7W1_TAXCH|nr:hypothetical protein KI387_042836 [Taxus chinensis]